MQELYKNYIAWLEGKIEDYDDIFVESEYSDKPLVDYLQNVSKDEWLRQTQELIRQYKLPQSYLDDDYLDIDDLFEEGYTPDEAVQVLIDNQEI